MAVSVRTLAPCLVLAGAAALAPPLRLDGGTVHAYPDHPPLAHTGGFGEPTCQACHIGSELNDPAGSLALRGVPESYAPGERYRITVVLSREGMETGGFQLAARCEGGGQAGTLAPADDRVAAVAGDAKSGVQYAHQTADGVDPALPGSTQWVLEWTAPEEECGAVRFDAAANAADRDDSPLGDYVYTRSLVAELLRDP